MANRSLLIGGTFLVSVRQGMDLCLKLASNTPQSSCLRLLCSEIT